MRSKRANPKGGDGDIAAFGVSARRIMSAGDVGMDDFGPYLRRWKLTPDGEPLVRRSAALLPVTFGGRAAMLKIAHDDEERRGGALLRHWDGVGAVHVFAQGGDAVLMERANGSASLAEMARSGRDDDSCRVICEVAAKLHQLRGPIPQGFVPLRRWFAALEHAASREGGIFAQAWRIAQDLLAAPCGEVALHGDLHHANVLDSARGWLAIDPKCVLGERGFEYAVIFGNPDPQSMPAEAPFRRRLEIIAEAAGLGRDRLLRWCVAQSALSAAWSIEDGDEPIAALRLASLAQAELARSL